MKRYALLVLFVLAAVWLAACGGAAPTPTAQVACANPPTRTNAAQDDVAAGAVVVYERIGVGACMSEVWSFYPDGRITSNVNGKTAEKTVPADQITTLVSDVDKLGFFKLVSTTHTACRDCFTYYITVKTSSQTKTVSAVDGGTDTPTDYWQVFAKIKRLTTE